MDGTEMSNRSTCDRKVGGGEGDVKACGADHKVPERRVAERKVPPRDELQQWADLENMSKEDKLDLLTKWANMDVPALALETAKWVVLKRPVLMSFWVFGLLVASFAGGLPVDSAAEEAYSTMLQQAEVIDSRELGQQALVELEKSEEIYYASKGWFGSCEDACQKAYDKVQLARAEVARVQKHRDRVLSEARHEVGIWSSFGVQDVRKSFWAAWQSGKDFAARCTFYNVLFTVGSREESIYVMIFRLVMQYVVNLTMGLIGAFCYFMYSMYCLIVSYGSSFLTGAAFFLLASVAGLSMLATYLTAMYAVVAGGGAMLVQQAAKHAALEMGKQERQKREMLGDSAQLSRAAAQPRRCPV